MKTNPRLKAGVTSLGLLSSLTLGCAWSQSANENSTSNLNSRTNPFFRSIDERDLILTFPRHNPYAAEETTSALKLLDILPLEKAKATLAHLTLKTDLQRSDFQGIDGDQIEEQQFWKSTLEEAEQHSSLRGGLQYRQCLEDPQNWSVGALRFSPSESLLPGAAEDWSAAIGASPSKVMQLRFSLRAECAIDDAGIHVVYNLLPGDAAKHRFVTFQVVEQMLTGKADEARALAKNHTRGFLASRAYKKSKTELINSWLRGLDEARAHADSQENLNIWKGLSSRIMQRGAETGYLEKLSDTATALVGKDEVRGPRDIGAAAFSDRDSAASQKLRGHVQSTISQHGHLFAVTTFLLTGLDKWTFGKLAQKPSGKLEPSEIRTFDTVFPDENRLLSEILVKQTSTSGMYESLSEFDATADPTLADHKIDPAFGQRNIIFSGADLIWNSLNDFGKPEKAIEPSAFIKQVLDTEKSNPTNTTCSACHLTLIQNTGSFLSFKAGDMKMLTGQRNQINLRTAAELQAEINHLKK